jgi:hypothetical protein
MICSRRERPRCTGWLGLFGPAWAKLYSWTWANMAQHGRKVQCQLHVWCQYDAPRHGKSVLVNHALKQDKRIHSQPIIKCVPIWASIRTVSSIDKRISFHFLSFHFIFIFVFFRRRKFVLICFFRGETPIKGWNVKLAVWKVTGGRYRRLSIARRDGMWNFPAFLPVFVLYMVVTRSEEGERKEMDERWDETEDDVLTASRSLPINGGEFLWWIFVGKAASCPFRLESRGVSRCPKRTDTRL